MEFSNNTNDFFVYLNDDTTSPSPSLIPDSFPTFAPSPEPPPKPTEEEWKTVELTQFGFTIAVGMAILVVVLFAFAVAMRCRSTHIAPRCEARPRNVIFNPDPMCDPCQQKGSPFLLGWIPWVMQISYSQLLAGVPGTGTRQGGMKGRMLNVNLDHVLLLRFNSLALKISIVSMLVYITICLPIYFYARCSDIPLGDVKESEHAAAANCTEGNFTFTSYSRFTLANIPDLNNEFLTHDYHLASFQIYVVVLSSWLVIWFACFELFHEWVDMVAIRRVYYLEYDHWRGAKKELEATMMRAVAKNNTRFDKDSEEPEEKHLFEREAWIPHPEIRDTPSNVELYSVLVGGIPCKPKDMMDTEDLEAALAAENSQVDWQMTVVSAFFDSCIPNQPGFTSSVAAVTILPSATELATAWQHWYKAAKKLSRLRFIRHRIIELGHPPGGQKLYDDDLERSQHSKGASKNRLMRNGDSDVFASDRRKEYSAEVLGAGIKDDVNDEFWKSLDLGPEQIAVYSNELAKGLAGCCPHGFCEQRITWSDDIDELLEMESEAAEEVKAAYAELKEAGKTAALSHEKRQELLKVTDFLVDSKAKLESLGHSTTEMQILKKHRTFHEGGSMSIHGGLGAIEEGDRSGTMRRNPKGVSFARLSRSDGQINGMPSNQAQSAYARMEGNQQSLQTETEEKGKFKTSAASSRSGGFEAGLMRRASVRMRVHKDVGNDANSTNDPDPWEAVETIASETKNHKQRVKTKYKVANGTWRMPASVGAACRGLKNKITSLLMWTGDNSNEATDVLARDSTFAVVTFTSRQAAIAARNCLADGRGADTFMTIKTLPVPPLADSAALNFCDCRGCMKPVTIGLNDHQKQWRRNIAFVLVALTYVFYTVPITAASKYGTEAVFWLLPNLSISKSTVTGFLNAQILSLFLSILPELFMWIANFGSNATSLVESENAALRYYWYFMVCFAIIGSSIAQMAIDAYNNGSFNIADNLRTIAQTIPVSVSANWANWTILRATIFTPAFYLLQLNTYLSAAFGLHCCVRMFRGGGTGNRLPYRIYVESGSVLLFAFALAPAAPLVAPFVVLYFLVCSPLLRYVVLFTYKPPFDSGGSRWPLMFDMIITSMVVAQVLLGMMVLLKQAVGPAVLAAIPLAFIWMFRQMMVKRFLAAYMDAALLQSSQLDGWDVGPDAEGMSYCDREEFRRFLVDAHKASFVPVCIAATLGGGQSQMTAEPAVTEPVNQDEVREMEGKLSKKSTAGQEKKEGRVLDRRDTFKRKQFGALNRRHLVSTRDLLDESNGENTSWRNDDDNNFGLPMPPRIDRRTADLETTLPLPNSSDSSSEKAKDECFESMNSALPRSSTDDSSPLVQSNDSSQTPNHPETSTTSEPPPSENQLVMNFGRLTGVLTETGEVEYVHIDSPQRLT